MKMTRQEASKIIEQYRMCSSGDCPTLECADCEYNHDPRKVEEAFLMAIDALESAQPEPCDDCVSRKAVIRLLYSSYHSKSMIEEVKELPSAHQTLYGYDIEHLKLIANVLQKENLPPERVAEALMDIGRIVAIVTDEFEETLRKSVEQSMNFAVGEERRTNR